MELSLSYTEENYIKAVYHLSHDNEQATTTALAEIMQTKPATVSDMIQKLARKKILNYKKYHGVDLTPKGKSVALKVIRKHRLWEVFLYEKLKFNWDEVHDIAEQLEHIQSPLLVERLDDFLGSPKVDPHGDPIPDSEGNFHVGPQYSLVDLNIEDSGVISSVTDSDPQLLKHLDHINIRLGLKIKVTSKVSFDGSMQVDTGLESPTYLSHQVASHLMITKL